MATASTESPSLHFTMQSANSTPTQPTTAIFHPATFTSGNTEYQLEHGNASGVSTTINFHHQTPSSYHHHHRSSSSSESSIVTPTLPSSNTEQDPVPTSTPVERERPRVTTTLWEDEATLCYQVDAKGVCVARREDNDMINGTKLLNLTGMSRGRRDGLLKTEKVRHVVKVGAMHLKGVWIPFERAVDMATKEGIADSLYPLFVKDIKEFLYHPTADYPRTLPEAQENVSDVGSAAMAAATATATATASASVQSEPKQEDKRQLKHYASDSSFSQHSFAIPNGPVQHHDQYSLSQPSVPPRSASPQEAYPQHMYQSSYSYDYRQQLPSMLLPRPPMQQMPPPQAPPVQHHHQAMQMYYQPYASLDQGQQFAPPPYPPQAYPPMYSYGTSSVLYPSTRPPSSSAPISRAESPTSPTTSPHEQQQGFDPQQQQHQQQHQHQHQHPQQEPVSLDSTTGQNVFVSGRPPLKHMKST